jgi:uncharacterized protein (TIGR02145 family)
MAKKVFVFFVFSICILRVSAQDNFIDPRDGNVYKTITVQGMIWMAENLKYSAPDGAVSFDKDSNNIPIYGILYNWETATKVCPDGWHLPSGKDFQNLVNTKEQKETWEKQTSDPNTFGIQLAGMQDFEGTFTEMDESAYFWTSTEYDNNAAEYFSYVLIDNLSVIDISRKGDVPDVQGSEKANKYSVRCIKDPDQKELAGFAGLK